MSKVGLLAALLALGACNKPGPSPEDVKADFKASRPIIVGIIGNSVACGAGSDHNDLGTRKGPWVTTESEDNPKIGGWANQLRVWLRSRNPNSEVWNLSAGGFTVQNHLDSKTVAQLASRNPKPSLVFVPLQINDFRFNVPLATFKTNTVTLLKQITSEGMTPVLVKENKEPQSMAEYEQVLDHIAHELHVEVIDTYTPFDLTSMMSSDQVHPNQAGHDTILLQYEKWFEEVK